MALENSSRSSYFAGRGKYKGTKEGEVVVRVSAKS
jgi:hypothetical protein